MSLPQTSSFQASPLPGAACFSSNELNSQNSGPEDDSRSNMENPPLSVGPKQAESSSASDHSTTLATPGPSEAPAPDHFMAALRLIQRNTRPEGSIDSKQQKEPSTLEKPHPGEPFEPNHRSSDAQSAVPAAAQLAPVPHVEEERGTVSGKPWNNVASVSSETLNAFTRRTGCSALQLSLIHI